MCMSPENSTGFLDDLTKLKYRDASTHLPDDKLFIVDNTTALAVHLSDNEDELLYEFYKGVVQFCSETATEIRLQIPVITDPFIS